jgi:multiple sugar transport system substrate-binding protein
MFLEKFVNRVILVGICVILTFSLFGSGATPEKPGVTPETPGERGLEAGPPESFKGTEIHLAIIGAPGIPQALKHLDDFEARTGIKVTYDMLPELTLREKTTMDLALGTGIYDGIMFGLMYVVPYAEPGWLLPLDAFIESKATESEELGMSDYISKFLEANTFEGKLYGLPFYGETSVFAYRKDLFNQYNLKPPKTLEDVRYAAQKLTQKEEDFYGITLRGKRGGGMNVYTWTGWLWAFGGRFFNEKMEPVLDSPEAIKSLEEYASILHEYGPPGSAGFEWTETKTWLQEGKAAMTLDASPFVTLLEDTKESKTAGKWGYISPSDIIIQETGKNLEPTLYTWSFGISTFSRHPWATWKFLSWICSKKLAHTLANEGFLFRGAPTRKSMLEITEEPWWTESVLEAAENARIDFRPRISVWREVGDRIGIAVEQAIAGIKPAKTALTEANKDVYDIMKRAGYYE